MAQARRRGTMRARDWAVQQGSGALRRASTASLWSRASGRRDVGEPTSRGADYIIMNVMNASAASSLMNAQVNDIASTRCCSLDSDIVLDSDRIWVVVPARSPAFVLRIDAFRSISHAPRPGSITSRSTQAPSQCRSSMSAAAASTSHWGFESRTR